MKKMIVGLALAGLLFTGCTPNEQALVAGAIGGAVVGASVSNGYYYNNRYYDNRYYYNGRYMYGGYYRNGYYYYNGRSYRGGSYYRY